MQTPRLLKLVAVVMLTVAPPARSADISADLQAKFSTAVTLLQADKFAEALPLLQEVAAQVDDRPNVFWNLGIAAAAVGDKQLALHTWSRYREMMPDDVRGREKLIQSYQALGMNEQRDSQRNELLALRAALPAVERDKMVFFARDQFDAGGLHFVTLEYFEPHGRFRDLYRFEAVDATHKLAYYLSLENDAGTTAVGRELGQIPPDGQLYSLDRFEGSTHSTLAIMKVLPVYDALRTLVVAAAEGRLRATASSTPLR